MRAAPLLAAFALAGCGSAPAAELPPAAGPPRSDPAMLAGGEVVVRVLGRERALEARDADTGELLDRTWVGVGPTHVVSDGIDLAYVADTAGDAILVVRLRPRLQVTRRVALEGRPYALAMDDGRDRLYVTLLDTGELVQLTGDGRPRVLQRFPTTVERPERVVLDDAGAVTVIGRSGGPQRIEPGTPTR